jgi:hypothetical protein
MQKRAKEVAPSVTSHNQKQQHTQCNHKTQTAANRPQEAVRTEPKTTTNKQKTTLQPNSQPTQKTTKKLYSPSNFSLSHKSYARHKIR